jgi:hypothetical protein
MLVHDPHAWRGTARTTVPGVCGGVVAQGLRLLDDRCHLCW